MWMVVDWKCSKVRALEPMMVLDEELGGIQVSYYLKGWVSHSTWDRESVKQTCDI